MMFIRSLIIVRIFHVSCMPHAHFIFLDYKIVVGFSEVSKPMKLSTVKFYYPPVTAFLVGVSLHFLPEFFLSSFLSF